MIKPFNLFAWIAAAGFWCASLVAHAGPITLVGTTINYEYDDAQAALALFGAPRVVGDAVLFLPPAYRAESLDGAGAVTADAEFIFSSVYSRDGSGLGGINVFEFGDYGIINAGSVSAAVELTVADNDSAASAMAGESFADNVSALGLQFFTLSAVLDLEAEFNAPANDISVAIHNSLTATSAGPGEGAWIQNKLGFAAVTRSSLNPPTAVVPAPGVVWLFGAGLLALGGARRRTRQTVSRIVNIDRQRMP